MFERPFFQETPGEELTLEGDGDLGNMGGDEGGNSEGGSESGE